MLLLTSIVLHFWPSWGSCDCTGCTGTITVSDPAWLPAPSACSGENEVLVVSELRVASTDLSTFDVTSWVNSSKLRYYIDLSSSGADTTCFNMPNLDIGITADMRPEVTCKNNILSCPLQYDLQYACRKLEACPCPACNHNMSIAAGGFQKLSPDLNCPNGIIVEKLQVRSLNAGRTLSSDQFVVYVQTSPDPQAGVYLQGPSCPNPSSCFSYNNVAGEYIDSSDIYLFFHCKNAELPCSLELVARRAAATRPQLAPPRVGTQCAQGSAAKKLYLCQTRSRQDETADWTLLAYEDYCIYVGAPYATKREMHKAICMNADEAGRVMLQIEYKVRFSGYTSVVFPAKQGRLSFAEPGPELDDFHHQLVTLSRWLRSLVAAQ
eukprot:g28525.t1